MSLEGIDKSLIYRTSVIVAGVGLILWGCIVVLQPFIPALLLAVILCLSTWPAFDWLQKKLRGRRSLAAFLMTILLALCFLVPLLFLGSSLADNFTKLVRLVTDSLGDRSQPPAWLDDIPFAGEQLDAMWQRYIGSNDGMRDAVTAYARPASQWLIKFGATIGHGILDLSLGVLIAFFFFRNGVQVAEQLSALIGRFSGSRGQHLLSVSKKTMIGVVYGMLGTALAQGALAGVGFWIANVPGAPFLGLLTFLLSFLPVGPPLIWVPSALWLFQEGETAMGIFMVIWGLLVISAVDNIIRPYFISLGSSLPLLLVLLGVFGGIIAFGFIGLFIGPTLLALAYTLIKEWSHTEREHDEIAAAPPGAPPALP